MPGYLDRAALLAALTSLQEQDFPTRDRAQLDAAIATAQAALAALPAPSPDLDADENARRLQQRGDLLGQIAEAQQDLKTLNLFGGQLRIRELTAAQREEVRQAAFATDPDQPDNALYWAMVVSLGVAEPILSLADTAALRSGRAEVVHRLALAILSLSEAAPGSLKSGDPAPDRA